MASNNNIPTINKILESPKESNIVVRKQTNLSKKAQAQKTHEDILNKFAPDSMSQFIKSVKDLEKKLPNTKVEKEEKRREQKRINEREDKRDRNTRQQDKLQKKFYDEVKKNIKEEEKERKEKKKKRSGITGKEIAGTAKDLYNTPLIKGMTQGLLGGFNLLIPPLEALWEPIKVIKDLFDKRKSKPDRNEYQDTDSSKTKKNNNKNNDSIPEVLYDIDSKKSKEWDKTYNLLNNIWLTEFRIDNTLTEILAISKKSMESIESNNNNNNKNQLRLPDYSKQQGLSQSQLLLEAKKLLLPEGQNKNQLLLPDLRKKPESEKGNELIVKPAEYFKKTPRRNDIIKVDPGSVLLYDLFSKESKEVAKKKDNVMGDMLGAMGIQALMKTLLPAIMTVLPVLLTAALPLILIGVADIIDPGSAKVAGKGMEDIVNLVTGKKGRTDKEAEAENKNILYKGTYEKRVKDLQKIGINSEKQFEEEVESRIKKNAIFTYRGNAVDMLLKELNLESQYGLDKSQKLKEIPYEQRIEILKSLGGLKPKDISDEDWGKIFLGEFQKTNAFKIMSGQQKELLKGEKLTDAKEFFNTLAKDSSDKNKMQAFIQDYMGGEKSLTAESKVNKTVPAQYKKHNGGKAYEEQWAYLRKDEVVLSPNQSKLYKENNGRNNTNEIKTILSELNKNNENDTANSNEIVSLLKELNKTLKDKQLNNNTVISNNDKTFDPNTIRYHNK
jgi:hypothetical protein